MIYFASTVNKKVISQKGIKFAVGFIYKAMTAEWRLNFPVILFIYIILSSSQFAISKQSWNFNVSLWNSTARVPTFWINKPFVNRNYSTTDFSAITPVLLSGKDSGSQFLCGFVCNYEATGCLLGTLLAFYNSTASEKKYTILYPQLVWSANRNRPVKANATLQLGQDGNLVLLDSDGTLVWSTNSTGKSVSGLNLTERGNLVLFDIRNRAIWQSFDHPTDSLLSGQDLVSGQKLVASISASNKSQGLLSLSILNGSLVAYTDTNPPQYYYASDYTNDTGLSFDGHTLRLASTFAQFMKLEHNGHLRLYQFDIYELDWKVVSDVWTSESDVGNCGYPMVCGRYSICTSDGQCNCPYEGNFFRPSIGRKTDLGCTALTPITCDSLQYHSLLELSDTRYFAFDVNFQLNSSIWFKGIKLEDCKTACLHNCSCKAVVWDGTRRKNCLLLNEVFSIMDNGERRDKTTVFLKVQNQSPITSGGKQSRPVKVILGSTLAALVGIILSITTWFILFKKRSQSSKVGDFLDIEPLLPGILTRFSYNELKIITEDFSKKLGEGGFGSVYEGTLSNGTKIAVKHLDGVGQVKDSFLTEVNIVGGIHHVNLVKLIGFCAEKSDRLLIYEYMVNGSLDRWISHEKQENRLTWKTRQSIISDIAKGLAYLHEDCSHKIIHLDIKPQNILLDQYFNAKISDFGLSKLIEKDKSKVVTRMRGTPGYLAPEWLSSVITEKVDVYAFGIVLLEILCGRKNLDWSQTDEEDVHLLSVFRKKLEQQQLTDMVDKNDEDMLLHKDAATEMMSIAAWCLQGNYSKRPSMSLVVKVLEGLVTVETDLDYNFTNVPEVREGNQQREATISSRFPSVLSGPR